MNKIEQYYKDPSISNSLLGLMYNPRWVKMKMENPELEDKDKSFFRIGSALDCLLTDPDRWDVEFIVVDANKPYGLMGKFIDGLPEGLTPDSHTVLYIEAYEQSGYRMRLENVISKFWENAEAVNYYQLTRNIASNVIILSRDEYDIVTKSKELIEANPFIRDFFNSKNKFHEILKQVPIYFTYKGEPCKGLLDGILIDHDKRTIQPYDLKTTRSVYDFPESYLTYGYYRQCAFYGIALQQETSPVYEYIKEGYEILDFLFIAVENKKTSTFPAIIYRTNQFDRERGIHGGWVKNKYYKGIDQLIDEYKYYRDNNYWDLPLDLLQSKGEIQLHIFDESNTEKPILCITEPESDSF
jgi:hypothetical protein